MRGQRSRYEDGVAEAQALEEREKDETREPVRDRLSLVFSHKWAL
jgi:hypothetical protein